MSLASQIESILFVASKPLSAKNIAASLDVSISDVENEVRLLRERCNTQDSGIHILTNGNDIQMATNPAHEESIESFVKKEVQDELTRAQLETLTVVAYRGPITRPELEDIRGVNCSIILRNLQIRGLIDEDIESDALGSVYRISTEALAHLGIAGQEALPEYERLRYHEHLEVNEAQ